MMIHPEQQNVRVLCELADFIDSGFQSFREQSKLPAKEIPKASFFSGASLVLRLLAHFRSSGYSEEDVNFLTSLLALEVNAYMSSKNLHEMEWEPHVPSSWQQ